jgi:hypothetical protein
MIGLFFKKKKKKLKFPRDILDSQQSHLTVTKDFKRSLNVIHRTFGFDGSHFSNNEHFFQELPFP